MTRAEVELDRSSIQVEFLATIFISFADQEYILLCGKAEYVARSTMTLDNITGTISSVRLCVLPQN